MERQIYVDVQQTESAPESVDNLIECRSPVIDRQTCR
jgi:hypothetical protein